MTSRLFWTISRFIEVPGPTTVGRRMIFLMTEVPGGLNEANKLSVDLAPAAPEAPADPAKASAVRAEAPAKAKTKKEGIFGFMYIQESLCM